MDIRLLLILLAMAIIAGCRDYPRKVEIASGIHRKETLREELLRGNNSELKNILNGQPVPIKVRSINQLEWAVEDANHTCQFYLARDVYKHEREGDLLELSIRLTGPQIVTITEKRTSPEHEVALPGHETKDGEKRKVSGAYAICRNTLDTVLAVHNNMDEQQRNKLAPKIIHDLQYIKRPNGTLFPSVEESWMKPDWKELRN